MKTCENCLSKNDGLYASGRFCNLTCARSFSTKNGRAERNDKISKTLTKSITVQLSCKWCEELFCVPNYKKHQIFCSRSCGTRYKNSLGMCVSGGRKSAVSQNKRSKNEILFGELCSQLFDTIFNEPMFNGWDADIILPKLKIAILWNGKWHYEKLKASHSVLQVQNRDAIKINEIIKAGYTPYIIKDLGKHNPEFVKLEFQKFIHGDIAQR